MIVQPVVEPVNRFTALVPMQCRCVQGRRELLGAGGVQAGPAEQAAGGGRGGGGGRHAAAARALPLHQVRSLRRDPRQGPGRGHRVLRSGVLQMSGHLNTYHHFIVCNQLNRVPPPPCWVMPPPSNNMKLIHIYSCLFISSM